MINSHMLSSFSRVIISTPSAAVPSGSIPVLNFPGRISREGKLTGAVGKDPPILERISYLPGHRYLEFYGKKESNQGQPSVFVYNSEGKKVVSLTISCGDLDGEWHQYVIELPKMKGEATIILNGGYIYAFGR